jgi:hypothetical protein
MLSPETNPPPWSIINTRSHETQTQTHLATRVDLNQLLLFGCRKKTRTKEIIVKGKGEQGLLLGNDWEVVT